MRCAQALSTKNPKPRSTLSRSFSKCRRGAKDKTPTSTVWKSWKRMKFCAVEDPRNPEKSERIVFRVGEDILVLNNGWQPDRYYDLWNSWVGKIVDIRGNSPRNTWVIVQWYYSGEDIAQHGYTKSEKDRLDTSSYGKFERSLSVDRQVISISSINGKATVVEFDDSSPLQEPIPSDCFYVRREYTSSLCSVNPRLESSVSCTCGNPYNPDSDNCMRFCPRFGCRVWYHENCLGYNDRIYRSPPDECIQAFLDIRQENAHKIPPELLRLACEPIIRGAKHGVVGNVKAVCEAREWARMYACTPLPGVENRPGLVLNGNTLDQWLDSLDGIEVEKLVYPDDVSGCKSFFSSERDDEAESLCFTCPTCNLPI